jgi:hypothetical protein
VFVGQTALIAGCESSVTIYENFLGREGSDGAIVGTNIWEESCLMKTMYHYQCQIGTR